METNDTELSNNENQKENNNSDQQLNKKDENEKPNAHLTSNYIINENTEEKNTYFFNLPPLNITSFTYKLNEFKNLNLDEKDSKINNWKKSLEECTEYFTPYSANIENRKSSLFDQGIVNDNDIKTISDFKLKKVEGEIRGEVALLKVAKLLGLGDVVNVPLPHSGFWVSLKPPTEKDLMDFYTVLFREKVILGRATSGLTLSNFSVYVNSKILEFILKHVHSTSLIDVKIEDLGNYILLQDLSILAWGFACSIYSNGFEYSRPCVRNPEECTYVAKGTIDPKKLLWVDNTSFTSFQLNVLSENRPNKHTVDTYRKFILDFKLKHKTLVEKDIFKIHFKIPTLNEWFSDGLQWINKINNSIESVVIEDSEKEEETKRELLTSYIKSSVLRQYSHLVESIEVEDAIINDRETINSVLEQFSANDEFRTKILEHINNFINDNIFALIGIPEYKCPNCGNDQNTNSVNDLFVNVIPLDAINLFFGLITLRIAKMTEREI